MADDIGRACSFVACRWWWDLPPLPPHRLSALGAFSAAEFPLRPPMTFTGFPPATPKTDRERERKRKSRLGWGCGSAGCSPPGSGFAGSNLPSPPRSSFAPAFGAAPAAAAAAPAPGGKRLPRLPRLPPLPQPGARRAPLRLFAWAALDMLRSRLEVVEMRRSASLWDYSDSRWLSPGSLVSFPFS